MEAGLWRAIDRLQPLHPRFVSVTYGAGGTTRERTHATVVRIRRETGLTPAAHLTCVGADRAEIDTVARQYWEADIHHIVALRGDPSTGETRYRPHPSGYRDAADLVAGLKKIADFDISVAAYPEGHPDSASAVADIDNLCRKVAAGANRAISQYFFDPDCFLRLRDRAYAAGARVPLVAGILPVTNFNQLVRFSAACGASVPSWLADLFQGLDNDPETRKLVAASVAADLCRRLQAEGVEDFHFYTLNRADLAYAICHILGVRPVSASSSIQEKIA